MMLKQIVSNYFGKFVFKNFRKLVRNRDKEIQELIVTPRDKMIKELQKQNSLLYLTLQNQVNTVERASKYEKERKSIICENRELKEKYENMENDYSVKFKEEIRKVINIFQFSKIIQNYKNML